MRNETTMTKPTVTNLYSGQIVTAGYKRGERDFTDTQRFVGFKVGEQFFSNLKLAKQAFGVRNLKELEFETDRLEVGSVTAEFYDANGQFHWASYLWNGAFRVGSSADRLTLVATNNSVN